MSITLPRNFASLIARNPDLAEPLKLFARFLRAHPDWDLIDSRDLSKALRDVDPYALASAVSLLVRQGSVQQLYAVTTPSGSLSDQFFKEPTEIPEKLPDRFNQYFDTAEQDVVPVLVSPRR